jgi:hypothetical protein
MEYFSSDEADPAAYLAGLQGTYVADEVIHEDLDHEEEMLESLGTSAEEVIEEAIEAVAEVAAEPAGEAPADQVLTEEEPPESSAV